MKFILVLFTCIIVCSSRTITNDKLGGDLDRQYFEDNYQRDSGANNAYWLFTRNNPTVPQVIDDGDVNSIWNSNYDSSKPLKVIVHGWTNNGTSRVNTVLTSAFLETFDVNVIVLDWSLSASGDYVSASLRVPSAGVYLGRFLNWLIESSGANWDDVHLVGYSLGAHLIGNAGRVVGGKPRRVTGLDPAGPFWSDNRFALNTQAGQYVEAIHTNILARGITEPIGHADFYPNGGNMQPGCEDNRCSHGRSYEFFASSVRTDHLGGRRCLNLILALLNQCSGASLNMGNGILSKRGNGIYALETLSDWPY